MPNALRFVVDESAFSLLAPNAPAVTGALERLVEVVEAAMAGGVGKLSTVWEEGIGAAPLYDWLFQPELGVETASDRLASTLGLGRRWVVARSSRARRDREYVDAITVSTGDARNVKKRFDVVMAIVREHAS